MKIPPYEIRLSKFCLEIPLSDAGSKILKKKNLKFYGKFYFSLKKKHFFFENAYKGVLKRLKTCLNYFVIPCILFCFSFYKKSVIIVSFDKTIVKLKKNFLMKRIFISIYSSFTGYSKKYTSG